MRTFSAVCGGLLALLIAPVAMAVAPLDGDGLFRHAVTLKPFKATAPMPIAPPVRFMAYGKNNAGDLILVGDAEYMILTPGGRLNRDRFAAANSPYPTMGAMAMTGGRLTYCAQNDKRLWQVSEGGKKRTALTDGLGFSTTCQLFAGKSGYLATQSWPMLAYHVSADGKKRRKITLHRAFLPKNRAKSVLPCGMTNSGRPIAAIPTSDRKQVGLWLLDDAMKAQKQLWSVDLGQHPHGKALGTARLPTATGCGFSDGHAVFWFTGQVLVFRGSDLVSALRNGTPLTAKNGHASPGSGPYAFSVISAAHVTAGGKVLAVVSRDTGEIKLYGADKAWRSKLARPTDSDAVRADLLRRWGTKMMAMGPMVGQMPWPKPLTATYLQQAREVASRKPNLPVAHAAVVVLAERAGQPSLRADRLKKLADALAKSRDKRQLFAYPALFDHFARLGDKAKMRRFVALSKGTRTPIAARWRAQLARQEGRYKAGIAALSGHQDGLSLALKARLLGDMGKLNEAITTWTAVIEGGLRNDPNAHNGMGTAWLQRGLVELAIGSFNKAVQLDPNNATFRANLATAYLRLDKRNDAMKHIFSALSKAPNDPLLRTQLTIASAVPKDAPAKPATVAVMPLTTAGSDVARAGLGDLVAAMLISAISAKNLATVVERTRLQAVLREQKLQRTRAFDRKTRAKVGKLVGAKTMVTGNVAEFAGRLVLDIRSVSIQTGAVIRSVHADVPMDPAKLEKALHAATGKLLK